jgi:hypothetical protein
MEMLKTEIAELDEQDFDISMLGFGDYLVDEEFTPDLPDDDEPKEKEVKFNLLVTLENEDAQQELFTELNERGFKVKHG